MNATIWEAVSTQPVPTLGPAVVGFTAAVATAAGVNKLIHQFTGVKGLGLLTAAAVTLGAANAILEEEEDSIKLLGGMGASMIAMLVASSVPGAMKWIPKRIVSAAALFYSGFLGGFISGLGAKSALNAVEWNEEVAGISVLLGGMALTLAKLKGK